MLRGALFGVALLALPPRLVAQQPATAPRDTVRAVTTMFEIFDSHYASLILTALDSIPASRYGFRPTPKQQSVGYIAQHLEQANLGLCERIGDVAAPRTAKDSLADTVKAMWPKDTLVARYRASLSFCKAALARMTDARLAEERTWGGERIPYSRSMLYFVTDLAEHYAQLASYMRLMGLVPPSALPRPPRQASGATTGKE